MYRNVHPRFPYTIDLYTIYKQNQEPNPTGNVSLTLDSKRRLVVLALRVLLTNKSLDLANVQRMELGIRN